MAYLSRSLSRLGQPVVSSLLQRRAATLRSFCVNGATAELFYDAKAQVAGDPYYERKTNQLLWVDRKERYVNFLNVETKENRSIQLSGTVGAAIPVAGTDKLVVLVGKRICLVDRTTGSTVKDLATIDLLENSGTLLSMGRCDRLGRLWCGTAGPMYRPNETTESNGALYTYAAVKDNLKMHPTGISIPGGLEWDDDYERMFCNDSLSKKVYTFEYNEPHGEIGNQEVLVDYATDNALGYPSGTCRDICGNLWIGGFLGGNVTCWDSVSGTMLTQLAIPAKRVVSCCYGGPDYEWLFITTARLDADEQELSRFPHSGGIFVVKGVGTKGIPAPKLRTKSIKIFMD